MAVTDNESFLSRLRATFEVEAREHLQAMSSILLEDERASGKPRPSVIEELRCRAHSLKGASRAVDLVEVEAICQALEEALSNWKADAGVASRGAYDVVHRALDMIGALVSTTAPPRTDESTVAQLIEQIRTLPPAVERPVPTATESPEIAIANRTALTDTVRIAVAKLEAGLLEAEGMLVLKSAVARRVTELRSLAGLFDQWHKGWNAVSEEIRSLRRAAGGERTGDVERRQFRISPQLLQFLEANLEHVNAVEGRLVSLVAQSRQDQHDLARTVDGLLESSKSLLMLPFSMLADLFPKMVRDLCRDQHKDASFTLSGGEIEIDKRILEGIKDALIHVLRNCVDHGIETPEDRARVGKPPRASVGIAVRQASVSTVEIVVTDDGAGIDVARVKEAAVARGILLPADADALSDEEAFALVFHSGLSTRRAVTELSGRGLGMAIVRTAVEERGGRVTITSRPNAGTSLRIVIPVSLATTRGLFVTAAGQTYVIPTGSVERVFRVKPGDIRTIENRETIVLDGQILPLARLDAVLNISRLSWIDSPDLPSSAAVSLVVLKADRRVAFVVDEVLYEEEILVRPLCRPLVRVRNVAGATVTESGKALPVLDAFDLVSTAQATPPAQPAAPSVGPPLRHAYAPAKRLLVVEDSITSRMLLKGLLEAAGYHVNTAADGADAFAALRTEPFDLVVSDVEMPRLNGLGLTAKIRADPRLAEMPVILVTGLDSREQREQGIDAGANAYIVKSNFDQSQLLEAVGRLTG